MIFTVVSEDSIHANKASSYLLLTLYCHIYATTMTSSRIWETKGFILFLINVASSINKNILISFGLYFNLTAVLIFHLLYGTRVVLLFELHLLLLTSKVGREILSELHCVVITTAYTY